METTDLEAPTLRKQIIDRVQTLDPKFLSKLLLIIDNFNINYNSDNDDDDVEIDYHFPTPETPEEASREVDEIEEEVKQGKFVTHEQGMAEIDKIIAKYEYSMVG